MTRDESLNSSEQPQTTDEMANRKPSTLLHRIDPSKNEARFYYLMVGPSLFEPHTVLRVWGRIGGHQQAMITPCQTEEEARKLACRLTRRRLNRGYRIVNSETPEKV